MQAVNSADQLSPSMGASASSNMNGLQQAAAEAAACSGQLPGAGSNPVNDFPNKMSSLGEVQRIIGLSLSKIQMGRNQRGGLPLHKNLLVATVLNKARDLYMQETMYMNYKMMTGQFAAAAASASNNANNNHGIPQPEQMHSAAQQHYHNYGNIAMANAMTHVHHDMADDDMEPVEANEADYDEDSESDVEDDCDVTSVQTTVSASGAANEAHTMTTNHMQYPPTTMASMLSLHMHMQQQQMQQHELQQQQQQQQLQQQPQPPTQQQSPEQPAVPTPVTAAAASSAVAASTLQPQHSQPQPQPSSSSPPQASSPSQAPAVPANANDEGFIDEPDCDCDARNFSTSESRVPFQYCYNCAPFHPSNGRGPTLVPSPCPSPTPPTATSNSNKAPGEAGGGGGHSSTSQHIGSCTPVIYDMDSQSTEVGSSEIHEAARGTKRRRSSGDSLEENDIDDGASKKRRESTETSPDTSRDESGYQSDSSQHEMFHPAFRGTTCSTNTNSEILAAPANNNSSTCTATTGAVGPGQTMEIDQITSLVSIFSFGQHIMAAAAAANSGNVPAGGISSITSPTNTSSSGGPPKAEAEEEEEKKEKKSESSEDSDSESDTSSDSGHSSDDHEAAKEEEQAASSASTKLTRSVSTPELCATSAAAASAAAGSTGTIMASEAPPCVEVASL